MLSKKELELEDLEMSQPVLIMKNEKACSGENTKRMAGKSFDKKIMGAIHRFNQAISAEARNSNEIILTEILPAWSKEDRGQNEGRLLDSWDSIR